jgi:hypothetical protein
MAASRQIITIERLKREALNCFLYNASIPVMGVFNVRTGDIFLWPCSKEKIGLIRDTSGEPLTYAGGFKLDKNLQMIMGAKGRLTPEEIQQLNQSRCLPRVIADTLDDLENDRSPNRLTGHEYILELCGELGSMRDYRGFTITQQDGKVEYVWNSGSLNSPYDDAGVRQRERGAKVSADIQERIKRVIDKWAARIPEYFISQVNFIINLTDKENKDIWAEPATSYLLFSSSSTKVPEGIVAIRKIIQDKTLNDTERLQQIAALAKKLLTSRWTTKSDRVKELCGLLVASPDSLGALMDYHSRLKAELGLSPSLPAASAASAAASAASPADLRGRK